MHLFVGFQMGMPLEYPGEVLFEQPIVPAIRRKSAELYRGITFSSRFQEEESRKQVEGMHDLDNPVKRRKLSSE